MRSVVSACFIALLLLLTSRALEFDGRTGLYPLAICLGALLFLSWLLLRQLAGRGQDGGEATGPLLGLGRKVALRLGVFVLAWLGYVLLLPFAGFILTSWAALYLSILATGAQRRLAPLAYCGVFALSVAVLLKTVLFVPVPEALPDEYLDRLIYSVVR